MKYEEIVKDIKNKVYYPTYLLFGEEAFYIDQLTHVIETSILTDMEKEFNFTVLYGRDTSIQDVINHAKRFPMMSNYQVIIIKEAQDLSQIDELKSYLEKPLKSTILVLCHKYKKPDKRKKFVSLIEKNGVLFQSDKLREDKIAAWISKYIETKQYKIDAICSQVMADHLGNDLTRITNEIDKLILNLPANAVITKDLIESNIGISKEFNIFELQHSLAQKDISKTNRIIQFFINNPKDNPLIVTISVMYEFYIRVMMMHQLKSQSDKDIAVAIERPVFFLQDYKTAMRNYSFEKLSSIIKILKEYDLKYKGVDNPSFNEAALYKEMTYKILN